MNALSPKRFRVFIYLLVLVTGLTLLNGCGEPPDTPIESDPSVPTAPPLPVADRKGIGVIADNFDEEAPTTLVFDEIKVGSATG